MSYYKFLAAGAIGPLSGHRWASDWLTVAEVVPCEQGVHACRVADLPYWIADELWRIELEGPVTAVGRKVVAPRGRLAARVTGWDADAAGGYVRACVGRAAWHAAAECAELDDGTLRAAADGLSRPDADPSGTDLAGLRELALSRQEAAARTGRPTAARVCGYLVDAVEMVDQYPVVAMGYIAARAAQARAVSGPAAPTADRYDAERRWQAAWLADRLGLPAPG